MTHRLFIANRGEVAVRIQRACRDLGIPVVQAHSQADRDAPYVHTADQAICIGPARARDSYLDVAGLVYAALATGATLVHPGYGFLSENADFAAQVVAHGLVFVGPPASAIAAMGNKVRARQEMIAAGVPCIPGSPGPLPPDPAAVAQIADAIGYPVIVKAAGGGGGRGMRVVADPAALADAVALTREEARTAFGNPELYMERFLTTPRHVEIQILCDAHGNAVHLGARDCSMQRRHQKVIEEAPAPGVPAALIDRVAESCLTACRRMGYVGAGTFEFLYEDGGLYFIEMNTRLQVEHPVTEMITGIDIVAAQIRIAMGQPLGLSQADVRFDGAAVECRINAEHPDTLLPAPGRITGWQAPQGPGLRVETHVGAGYTISPHYDSLIAKLIAHGPDRATAIARMQAALDDMAIDGPGTNLPLHRRLMRDAAFRQGGTGIAYLETLLATEGRA
ncbi:acetyl-CoA carboxylase biotin carboxylase subunit [Gemmobacter sp.]|uniref:acetyl-CoA carboxylase biotin carboxylase subunit n=1 Tax=Gemmobacter sp. TaxID=1898957 RepID=UPI002AFE4BF7|nr:acetyl-CoA carboxylase biotin carboxylase subunit [Gemmobacter sp.]